MKDPIDIEKAKKNFETSINELLRYRCMQGAVEDFLIITIMYKIEKGRYRICFKNPSGLLTGFMDECEKLFYQHYPKPYGLINRSYEPCCPCDPLES